MALVRILVDGYSLLHNWPELAPGRPRHSETARNELIHWLTQYQDTAGTPVTVFFDGATPPPGKPEPTSGHDLEVIYSSTGQTADELIERTAYRLKHYGEVLVVTDDCAERGTVLSLGGMASSCANFIQTVKAALGELQEDLKRHNRRERGHFRRAIGR
jgi:predicted RNA-binding protein with PIN domain